MFTKIKILIINIVFLSIFITWFNQLFALCPTDFPNGICTISETENCKGKTCYKNPRNNYIFWSDSHFQNDFYNKFNDGDPNTTSSQVAAKLNFGTKVIYWKNAAGNTVNVSANSDDILRNVYNYLSTTKAKDFFRLFKSTPTKDNIREYTEIVQETLSDNCLIRVDWWLWPETLSAASDENCYNWQLKCSVILMKPESLQQMYDDNKVKYKWCIGDVYDISWTFGVWTSDYLKCDTTYPKYKIWRIKWKWDWIFWENWMDYWIKFLVSWWDMKDWWKIDSFNIDNNIVPSLTNKDVPNSFLEINVWKLNFGWKTELPYTLKIRDNRGKVTSCGWIVYRSANPTCTITPSITHLTTWEATTWVPIDINWWVSWWYSGMRFILNSPTNWNILDNILTTVFSNTKKDTNFIKSSPWIYKYTWTMYDKNNVSLGNCTWEVKVVAPCASKICWDWTEDSDKWETCDTLNWISDTTNKMCSNWCTEMTVQKVEPTPISWWCWSPNPNSSFYLPMNCWSSPIPTPNEWTDNAWNSTSTLDDVDDLPSWIKNTYYTIEWRDPHSWANVINWYISDWDTLTYWWYDSFKWTLWLKWFTRKSPMTTKSDEFEYKFEAEWDITVNYFTVDWAYNVSKVSVKHKIDKTWPQLVVNDISEDSDNLFYANTIKATFVNKYDSIDQWEDEWLRYDIPRVPWYIWDTPQSRNHERTELRTIYFRDQATNSDNTFTINLEYDDSYLNNLYPSYISDERWWTIELLNEDGSTILATRPVIWNTVTFNTNDLKNNITPNSQAVYRLRAYDNAGNYSETAFYAVRDNTPPWLVNGSDSSSQLLAMKNMFRFPDSNWMMDITTTSIWQYSGVSPISNAWVTNGYSRFLAANNNQNIQYNLLDWWITTNNNCLNEDCALYNAWVMPNIEYRIEDPNTPTNNILHTINPWVSTNITTRFNVLNSFTHDFSRIDNDLVSNWTYRHYSSELISKWKWTYSGVCDLVGNCTNPITKYRVVSSILDNTNSKMKIELKDSNSDNKIFADLNDKYSVTYWLRDIYNNKIVPVYSHENNNKQIKQVQSDVVVVNGLYNNQINNTWTKWAHLASLELDDNIPTVDLSTSSGVTFRETNTWWINDSCKYLLWEWTRWPNGCFRMDFSSSVPTYWSYPYISSNSIFEISKLQTQASVYSWIDDNIKYDTLWTFNWETLKWTDNFVKWPSSWDFIVPKERNYQIWFWVKWNSSFTTNDSDYWKYVPQKNGLLAFTDFDDYKLNLEFASPIVYGTNDLHSLTLGSWSNFYKKVYKSPSVLNYDVIEKNLVSYNDPLNKETPWIVNFESRQDWDDNSININNWIYHWSTTLIANTISSTPQYKSYNLTTTSDPKWYANQLLMDSKNWQTYDKTKLKIGKASSLVYQTTYWALWDLVKLPSIWIWIANSSCTASDEYSMSRNYLTNNYALCEATTWAWNMYAIDDIAITWLTNNFINLTTDTVNLDANVNVWWEVLRYDVVNTLKKNIKELDSWLGRNNKVWCTKDNISSSAISTDANSNKIIVLTKNTLNWDSLSWPNLDKCTLENNGELITFIDWNTRIDCGNDPISNPDPNSICSVNKKRTIIVKNWALYIGSNITTKDTKGQLMVWVVKDGWLSNVAIDPSNPNPWNTDKQWWLYIDPEITNIDAFMFSQWPAVSLDITSAWYNKPRDVFFTKKKTVDTSLTNQLEIYWAITSLNTIGWSRKTTPECPYIVTNCNATTWENIAQMFDITYLRRFKYASWDMYGLNASDKIPYYPVEWNPASSVNKTKVVWGWCWIDAKLWSTTKNKCQSTTNTNLRQATLKYEAYPLIIERNSIWNSNPSILLKVNK